MKQKKENRVALLLRWTGSQKIWLFLAILLSAVSGLCIIVPYIGSAEKVLVPNNYASNVISIFEMFLNLNKNTNFAVDTVLQGFDLCRYTFGFTCQDHCRQLKATPIF